MGVIAFAGDWHGNKQWAGGRILSLGEQGVTAIFHVGDFGIWPGPTGKGYLMSIDAACARYGTQIWVTPGNHEHWSRFTQMWDNHPHKHRDPDGTRRPLRLTDHVTVLPRGHRWMLDGRSFVSLGGAPSVDYLTSRRIEGRTWWREEMIQPDDVQHTVAGGYADIMIAHDAPGAPYLTPGVESIIKNNPHGWSDTELAYAATGTRRITEAFLGVAPRLYVHGHFHTSSEATHRLPGSHYDTRIWALAADHDTGNTRLLDLDTMQEPGGAAPTPER